MRLLNAVLGDDTLKTITRELVRSVKWNLTIDWTVKESVRAKLLVLVKRVPGSTGPHLYKQEQATRTVLEQAALFAEEQVA
ncbi:MAG: type I restriction enzyme endonuclease domain-containing protein [Vicinamibacterales bacterium]